MKKILLSLIALMGSMSINAQVINVVKTEGGVHTFVGSYSNTSTAKYKVELSADGAVVAGCQGTAAAVVSSGDVQVPWVQLWAGGPKFATYSVSATAAEGTNSSYNWGAIREGGKGYSVNMDIAGTSHDTAKMLWGDCWKMPSKADFEALIANCICSETNIGGVSGFVFTGKGDYANCSLFLPDFNYWSSTPSTTAYQNHILYFYETTPRVSTCTTGTACRVLAIIDDTQASPVYLTSKITITSDDDDDIIKAGEYVHLFGASEPSNAAATGYVWTVEDTNIAQITDADEDGTNIFVQGKKDGKTKIIATAKDGTGVKGEYTLTVDSHTFGAMGADKVRVADAKVGDLCWFKQPGQYSYDYPYGVVSAVDDNTITIVFLFSVDIEGSVGEFESPLSYSDALKGIAAFNQTKTEVTWHIATYDDFSALTNATTLEAVNKALESTKDYSMYYTKFMNSNNEEHRFWTSTEYSTDYKYTFDVSPEGNGRLVTSASATDSNVKRYLRPFATYPKK